eukprot:scaffold86788_cov65-Phaeocystis_antarctica.AAC.2
MGITRYTTRTLHDSAMLGPSSTCLCIQACSELEHVEIAERWLPHEPRAEHQGRGPDDAAGLGAAADALVHAQPQPLPTLHLVCLHRPGRRVRRGAHACEVGLEQALVQLDVELLQRRDEPLEQPLPVRRVDRRRVCVERDRLQQPRLTVHVVPLGHTLARLQHHPRWRGLLHEAAHCRMVMLLCRHWPSTAAARTAGKSPANRARVCLAVRKYELKATHMHLCTVRHSDQVRQQSAPPKQ